MKNHYRNLVSCMVVIMLILVVPLLSFAASSSKAPSGYLPIVSVEESSPTIAAGEVKDILLIQTALPWESNANITALSGLGKSVDTIDMKQVPNANIEDYQVVMIVNDQVQSFYDKYAQNYAIFDQYVRDGGTLVFFACDRGWADGNNYTDLPGGVQIGDYYADYNQIVNSGHQIVTQELTNHPSRPLIDSDLYGNHCSHNYFVESTLPVGADIILRTDDAYDYPTLVVYELGKGKVIASGLTWEYTYDRYAGKGEQFGFGRALPDLFLYAFSIAGSHKTAGINVDIYPEDYWSPKRKEVYKAKEDLVDIVACITNNTDPDEEIDGVTLTLTVDKAQLELGYLLVYKRTSAEEIALKKPIPVSNYPKRISGSKMIITLKDLKIPKRSTQEWNDFVFRFKISDKAKKGSRIDAVATITGKKIDTKSEKLSDGGAKITVRENGKIMLTNRELMYKHFASNNNRINKDGAKEVNQLWQSLYDIAAERAAVVYHVDKYDCNDGDLATPTIDWYDDRKHLSSTDHKGSYHYDADYKTFKNETTVNQVAIKIKSLLKKFIDRSGGLSNGRFVAIIGGDAIIPFYRVHDPSKTVYDSKGSHASASGEAYVDASNNTLFTDIFYRDFDGVDWKKGTVENVYIGRIAGMSASSLTTLMNSSNESVSTTNNVFKVENNKRDGELSNYEKTAKSKDYNVVASINNSSTDIEDPWLSEVNDNNTNGEFITLFKGDAANVKEFDVVRFMTHGSVEAVQSSEKFYDEYISGDDLNDNKKDISSNFNLFKPFFIFDACLVGLVDGKDNDDLFNSLLELNVRGAFGASAVTWTPKISDFNDSFTNELFNGLEAGKALAIADKKFGGYWDSDKDKLTRNQMNFFGFPWASITPPKDRPQAQVSAFNEANKNSSVSAITESVNNKSITVDASTFTTTEVDGYHLVTVDGFQQLLIDSETPVVPIKTIPINIPITATIESVEVTFNNTVDLGNLNIPAYQPPPPFQDPDGLFPPGGYVNSPNDLGIFPAPQYYYKELEIVGYKQVLITILPLTYDTGTGQTALHQDVHVDITYTTLDKGVVQSFVSDKPKYVVGEEITATTNIENISSFENTFEATVSVLDLADKVISSDSVSLNIASNTAASLVSYLDAPLAGGAYRLVLEASDGSYIIGESQIDLRVVEGQIVSFDVPDIILNTSYGTLSTEFENFSNQEVTAYQNIVILDEFGEEVANLPQSTQNIESGGVVTFDTHWFPPGHLPSGSYSAVVAVTINDETYTRRSTSFDIYAAGDIVLSEGWNRISLTSTPDDSAIETVLKRIAGKYSAIWAEVNGNWKGFDLFNPWASDLETLQSGQDYWIYMTAKAILPFDGLAAQLSSPTLPMRVSGLFSMNNILLDQAAGSGYTFSITKPDGSAFTPVAMDIDGLNYANRYGIQLMTVSPSYPGGATPGDIVQIQVFKNGIEQTIGSPENGEVVLGEAGIMVNVQVDLEVPTPGDVNRDNAINLKDTILGLQTVTGGAASTFSHGDVNQDGMIGMAEVMYTLPIGLGMVPDPTIRTFDDDGFTVIDGDCNDRDSAIYPGAPEICGDFIDQDCNGIDAVCD